MIWSSFLGVELLYESHSPSFCLSVCHLFYSTQHQWDGLNSTQLFISQPLSIYKTNLFFIHPPFPLLSYLNPLSPSFFLSFPILVYKIDVLKLYYSVSFCQFISYKSSGLLLRRKFLGRKSFKKKRVGEEYQIVGNYIHPWELNYVIC